MVKISLQEFAQQVNPLSNDEAVIDVRSSLEHRLSRIKEARNIPLDSLPEHVDTLRQYKKIYLICASGNRSSQAQNLLTKHGIHQSVSVEGGMQLWEQLKLPVKQQKTGVISVLRQVFLVAGSLILISILLAIFIHSNWLYLAMFVGGGLLVSGATGWCTMAKILEQMPWNKLPNSPLASGQSSGCTLNSCTVISTVDTQEEWQEEGYTVRQFTNPDLAHYSYALVSEGEMAIIDPARDPEQYYAYAAQKGAKITAVFETHPHADFVSSHQEIANTTGASIYSSPLVGAEYTHTPFAEGDQCTVGGITVECLDTPGHSPDSISLLVKAHGKITELFSGDTLFVGDVGRPDLRESVGNITAEREELAGQMYETVTQKLQTLPDDVRVFPAHGAGSLCGKSLGNDPFTSIGAEKQSNPAFAKQTKQQFIERLTEGQPFIPKYFGHDVQLNKQEAMPYAQAINAVPVLTIIPPEALVVDTRSSQEFNAGHMAGAIHIANGQSFATWLGAIIAPGEQFVLVVADQESKSQVLHKIANIGYEQFVQGVYVGAIGTESISEFTSTAIDSEKYTIVDVRNESEVASKILFENSIHIPLHELRERLSDIPTGKPIVVHCAGGYRSAIAASILRSTGKEVYDLSTAVQDWM